MAYTENEIFNLVNGSEVTGESPYDLWKSLGNEGTAQDFSNYLKDDGESNVSEETLAQIEKNKNDISQLTAWKEELEGKIANAGAVKTVNGNEPDEAGNVAVKVPLKLSDLENDLFYSKKEEFITLNRSDFTPKYHIDDEGNETDFIDYFYYKGNQELEWLTAKDKIGFVATSTDEEGNKICNTHNVRKFEVTDYLDMYEDDEYSYFEDIFCDDCGAEGKIYGCDECGVEILSRADIVNGEISCGDTFLVTVYALDDEFGMYYDDIIIYKIDEKKIPIEYCDTSEIEEEIDALAEEVENL